jgi:hypothetical protein
VEHRLAELERPGSYASVPPHLHVVSAFTRSSVRKCAIVISSIVCACFRKSK